MKPMTTSSSTNVKPIRAGPERCRDGFVIRPPEEVPCREETRRDLNPQKCQERVYSVVATGGIISCVHDEHNKMRGCASCWSHRRYGPLRGLPDVAPRA